MNKSDIVSSINASFKEVGTFVKVFDQNILHKATNGKWSRVETLQHLILSAKPVAQGLKMPKLVLSAFGKSKIGSRSYQDLVDAYQQKLAEGGTAPSKFVPKGQKALGTTELLKSWEKTCHYLNTNLDPWSESDLDKYRMPHPLLGKITVREMLYFTIYHTGHHLEVMKKLNA